jgi:hypothetical protein
MSVVSPVGSPTAIEEGYYYLDHVIGTRYKPRGKWDIISIGHTTIYSDMFIWKSTKAKISRAANQLKLCIYIIGPVFEIWEAPQRVLLCYYKHNYN